MKKLNKMVLKKANIMSASEMKYITGGNGTGTCGSNPSDGRLGPICCVPYDTAIGYLIQNGWGSWCCDSCPTTEYCGDQNC